MKILKIILITIAPFVVAYLFFGFISMEFNCKNWNGEGRSVFIFFGLMGATFGNLLFFEHLKNNQQNT